MGGNAPQEGLTDAEELVHCGRHLESENTAERRVEMRQDTEQELDFSCKCCGRPYEVGVSVPYAPWRSYSEEYFCLDCYVAQGGRLPRNSLD